MTKRSPISRVRSITLTSMMLMMLTPPHQQVHGGYRAQQTGQQYVGTGQGFAQLLGVKNMPAHMVSGMDYYADRILDPPDFHAYIEVPCRCKWRRALVNV